jgi:hypothetical protein
MATGNQPVEELPHAIAPQRDLRADRLALAELEPGDRVLGLGDDRLLTGDRREVGDGRLEQRWLLRRPSDAHVDDDLDERWTCITLAMSRSVLQLTLDLVVVLSA